MRSRVHVVGGGVIGLACAWELSRNGHEVTVVAPAPGRDGASWVAAGMLAPVTEVQFGESALTALLVEGARRWPAFAAALEAATGHVIGYDTTGTVTVALDASDRASLDDLLAYQHALGLEAHRRSASECRRLVPALSPALRGGIEVPGDHQVDNRALLGALAEACRRGGVTFVEEHAWSRWPPVPSSSWRTAAASVRTTSCWRPGRASPPSTASPVPRSPRSAPSRATSCGSAPRRHARPAAVPHGARPRARALRVPRAASRRLGRRRCHRRGAGHRHRGAGRRGARAALRRPGDRPRRRRARAARGIHRAAARHAGQHAVHRLDRAHGVLAAVGHYRNGILLAPLTAEAVVDLVGRRPVPDRGAGAGVSGSRSA